MPVVKYGFVAAKDSLPPAKPIETLYVLLACVRRVRICLRYTFAYMTFTRRLPTSPRALLVRTGMRFCDFDLPNWAREIYRPSAREQQASMARALRLHRAEAALDCRS